jgi:hypothetical protein
MRPRAKLPSVLAHALSLFSWLVIGVLVWLVVAVKCSG